MSLNHVESAMTQLERMHLWGSNTMTIQYAIEVLLDRSRLKSWRCYVFLIQIDVFICFLCMTFAKMASETEDSGVKTT